MEALRVTSGELDLIRTKLADAVRRSDDNFFCHDGAAADDVIAIICVQHCSLPWPVAEIRDFSTDNTRNNALEGFFCFIFRNRNSVTRPSEALQTVPYFIIFVNEIFN